ncbi:hypothetical protein G9A89_020103 [Geosiphon pyriformis]|nr:hypothetical protein G9A89_020103 [Geosiphon pyriformis]
MGKTSLSEKTINPLKVKGEMNLMPREPFNKLFRLETLSSKRTDTAEMLKRGIFFIVGPFVFLLVIKRLFDVLAQAKRYECNAQDILSVIFPKQFQLYKDPVNQIEVLLRWLDDFLYITTDKAHAIRFLRVMNEDHPEYGCFINTEKTLVNFDHEEVKLSPTEFPWCGLLIHTKDLEVKCDYSRTLSTPLRDQMTIMSNIFPSRVPKKKLKQFMKNNCSENFLNTRLNSPRQFLSKFLARGNEI